MKTTKKTILVTGASRGFGRLFVETLAANGHHVYASMRGMGGRNAEAAQELREQAAAEGWAVEPIELDVTDQGTVDRAIQQIVDDVGGPDVVINNAGYGSGGPLETFDIEQVQHQFDVNVFGALRVTRAALPSMRKRGEGLFIHISTIMGRIVIPFAAPYTASKWALEGMMESLRYEVSQLGIDSVLVESGPFPTNFRANMVGPADSDRLGEYGELAEMPDQIFGSMVDLFEQEDGPKPQEVVDAVATLVDTPAGERPLRVVVDRFMGDAVRRVNETSEAVQEEMLESWGLSHFRQPVPKPAAGTLQVK